MRRGLGRRRGIEVRPGTTDAAERLRTEGHRVVLIVDQYDGRVFDDYNIAVRFVEEIGFSELMRRARKAVQDLPEGFLAAGFSNGGGDGAAECRQRRSTPVSGLSQSARGG